MINLSQRWKMLQITFLLFNGHISKVGLIKVHTGTHNTHTYNQKKRKNSMPMFFPSTPLLTPSPSQGYQMHSLDIGQEPVNYRTGWQKQFIQLIPWNMSTLIMSLYNISSLWILWKSESLFYLRHRGHFHNNLCFGFSYFCYNITCAIYM